MVISIWRRLGARPAVKSLTVLLALVAPAPTVQLSQQLCSSQNTGSASNAVSNHFNSNGACDTACSGFAFAVVQGQNCWCSNYVPADTTSTSDCSEACPGYPYENCGSQSAGLFGYVALGKAPLGTVGAATSTSTTPTPTPTPTSTTTPTTSETVQAVSTQPLPGGPLGTTSSPEASSPISITPLVFPTFLPAIGRPTATPSAASPLVPHVLTSSSQSASSPDPSPDPVTVQETVTESQSVSISFVSITFSTTSTSSTSQFIRVTLNLSPTTTSSTPTTLTTSTSSATTSTSSSSSTSWSATPFTSVMTVTGQIETLTITPTAPPATATTIVTSAKADNGGFFSNAGQVAGTFVAVAIVLVLLIAGAIWFFLRRSRRRQPQPAVLPPTADSSTPQRRPSRLSQMGLVGASGTQRERTGPTVPGIQTSGWGPSNGSEKSPADTLSAVDRRSSYPRVVDQRLEPTALWNPLHDNGSHVSIRSFRDDQDYSRRMLRIANPDDG